MFKKLTLCLALILLPLWADAQAMVAQSTFAMKLSSALGLGTATAPLDAENLLTKAGIAPVNGWIADQPMTPAILDELQNSMIDAAAASRIPVQALKTLRDLAVQYDLTGSYHSNEGQPPLDYEYPYPGYDYPPLDYYPSMGYGFYPGFYPYYGGFWLSDRWYRRGNHPGIGGKTNSSPIFGRGAWPRAWSIPRINGSRIWDFNRPPAGTFSGGEGGRR